MNVVPIEGFKTDYQNASEALANATANIMAHPCPDRRKEAVEIRFRELKAVTQAYLEYVKAAHKSVQDLDQRASFSPDYFDDELTSLIEYVEGELEDLR